MRSTNRLSATFLKTAPVGKHCDGAGLWLVKREDGGAQWVLRVTVHGRRREMGLGGYLRSLDAKEANASSSEIADIHTHTAQTAQTVRDILEQAEALCFNF